MRLNPIHPFPARMAPEIILRDLEDLPAQSVVLDPMSGSGTVLRGSVERGLDCIGFDADPLAVLMGRVWTRPLATGLVHQAEEAVSRVPLDEPDEPLWLASCSETRAFCRFWFEEKQYRQLAALANHLISRNDEYADALRLCLSRIIITKEKGASIARDTSHSRPHRVFFSNDFDVFKGFVAAAKRIDDRMRSSPIYGSASVKVGDARKLPLPTQSIDAVITSPPYLNALDYMRGHRLALVWLGFKLTDLRAIRTSAIGTEVGQPLRIDETARKIPGFHHLSARNQKIVNRYAQDFDLLMEEMGRVTRVGGRILLVVGNSNLQNVNIPNADLAIESGRAAGLLYKGRIERDIPDNSRYLPLGESVLGRRMKTETVLAFER